MNIRIPLNRPDVTSAELEQVTRCLTQVFAPGLPSLRCMERSEGWMTFRAGPDVYQPDTVALALRVRNPLDTARTVRSVTAVLAAAPALASFPAARPEGYASGKTARGKIFPRGSRRPGHV